MSDPIVTISAQDMFEMVRSIEVSAGEIRSSVQQLTSAVERLEKKVETHDEQLRSLATHADTLRRVGSIEDRVTQHDHAFTKQGERLGRLEARLDARVNPVAVAAVVAAFAAIGVNIVLALL